MAGNARFSSTLMGLKVRVRDGKGWDTIGTVRVEKERDRKTRNGDVEEGMADRRRAVHATSAGEGEEQTRRRTSEGRGGCTGGRARRNGRGKRRGRPGMVRAAGHRRLRGERRAACAFDRRTCELTKGDRGCVQRGHHGWRPSTDSRDRTDFMQSKKPRHRGATSTVRRGVEPNGKVAMEVVLTQATLDPQKLAQKMEKKKEKRDVKRKAAEDTGAEEADVTEQEMATTLSKRRKQALSEGKRPNIEVEENE
eukprot:scaffold64_cov338-Pavlova_lutheri.AAC.77